MGLMGKEISVCNLQLKPPGLRTAQQERGLMASLQRAQEPVPRMRSRAWSLAQACGSTGPQEVAIK